ncbi:hypothetical protein QQ045_018991 [Rhodiola kirilowii]
MDPIKIEKIEAMKKYHNKNTKSINNAFFVYILTALTCSIVFFTPFWYPSLESLLTITLPNHISLFLTPKWLFLLGNLIIFVLVGESKLLTSKPSQQQVVSEVYYSEYVSRSQSVRVVSADQHYHVAHNECNKAVSEITRSVTSRSKSIRRSGEGSMARSLSAKELSRRADDFIARVNRQRRLEATDLVKWDSM